MKKFIAIALILVMALSLCACGSQERYPEIADMLDAGDYEGAVMHIYNMYQNAQTGEAGGSNNDVNEPSSPTDEEWDVLRAYRDIWCNLCSYAVDGYISYWDEENETSYSGSAALAAYYEKLQALDKTVIDKWVDTDYTGTNYLSDYNGEDVNWDYESVLANFSKLENVLLQEIHTTTDKMENVTEGYNNPTWKYNSDGTVLQVQSESYAFELVETNPMNLYGTQDVTYDDAGKPVEIKYMDGDNVRSIVNITYDKNGNKINDHIKTNDGELDISYEYDSNNRLVTITHPNGYTSSTTVVYTYTYDDAGNMVREEKAYHWTTEDYEKDWDLVDYKYIREFTYDDNGALVSGFYKYEDWSFDSNWETKTVNQYVYLEQMDQYSFTTDDQGRPLTMDITYGNTVYVHGDKAGEVYDEPNDVSMVVDFVYGDYWFYTAG